MASNPDFVAFVCSQLEELGGVRHRKMFGDFLIYVNEKPVALVCDDTVWVKRHPALAELLSDAEVGIPYPGAKEHYVLDAGHKGTLLQAIGTLERVLPLPKPRGRNR